MFCCTRRGPGIGRRLMLASVGGHLRTGKMKNVCITTFAGGGCEREGRELKKSKSAGTYQRSKSCQDFLEKGQEELPGEKKPQQGLKVEALSK